MSMSPSINHPCRHRGSAMVITLLVLLVFMTLGAAALLFSGLDLKAANSDQTGHQALYVAEAGIQQALNSMNRVGVIDFQQDIVNRWSAVFGATALTIPGYPTMQYAVQVTANAANPSGAGTLTSTGTGDSKSRRVLAVGLQESPLAGSPGAMFLASDSVNPNFSGNAFWVDGTDHDLNANRITGGDTRPGIATRNDAATSAVVGELSTGQRQRVQGLGYSASPLTPSVMTTAGAGITDLQQLITDLLAGPHVNWTSSTVSGGDTLGTVSNPQITFLTQDDVRITGGASGAGILIANNSVTIQGNFSFTGWVIVRGATTINNTTDPDGTTVLGNATILGSLWTGDFAVEIGGSAIMDYSQAAMQLADNIVPGGATPKPMVITAWQEAY